MKSFAGIMQKVSTQSNLSANFCNKTLVFYVVGYVLTMIPMSCLHKTDAWMSVYFPRNYYGCYQLCIFNLININKVLILSI